MLNRALGFLATLLTTFGSGIILLDGSPKWQRTTAVALNAVGAALFSLVNVRPERKDPPC